MVETVVTKRTVAWLGSVVVTSIVTFAVSLDVVLTIAVVVGVSGTRGVAFGTFAPPVHPSIFASMRRISSPLLLMVLLCDLPLRLESDSESESESS